MNTSRGQRQAILAALLLVFLTTAWFVFAPLQVGGQVLYVIITGNSMEPGFQRGDLVLLRRAPAYQVGDIVAYRNLELQRYVFHRVIQIEPGHFVLKGDNNDWVDSYKPAAHEILGAFWLRLPAAGKVVQWLRHPLSMGLLAGLSGGILVAILLLRRPPGQPASPAERRLFLNLVTGLVQRLNVRLELSRYSVAWQRYMERARQAARRFPLRISPSRARQLSSELEVLFFLFSLLGFGALVIGLFAFTRPVQRSVPQQIPYQHQGLFAYTASVPPGVYDSTTLSSGQPAFPKLNCRLDLQFTYTLLGDEIADVHGTYRVVARVIEDRTGWQRTIPVQAASAFSSNPLVLRTVVDLCQAKALVESMQERTGFQSTYYSFVIVPEVNVSARVAGQELRDTFAPKLAFRFDSLLFYLVREDPQADPLRPLQGKMLTYTGSEANTLPLLGREFAISGLRAASAWGLGLGLAGVLGLGALLFALGRGNQAALLDLKYGPLLVGVQDEAQLPATTIEVASMDDLAKLAERHQTMILCLDRPPLRHYLVHRDGTAYRYTVKAVVASLLPLEHELREGLRRHEFCLYYQPVVSLTDKKIVAVEALLRWRHPQRGLISPGEFLPAAEAGGLIEKIGEWVLQEACAQVQEWHRSGALLALAVNISVLQLNERLVRAISHLLQQTGLEPDRLQFEMPESRMMEVAPRVQPVLQMLHGLGISLALDDFLGRAPLSLLEQWPLERVKLDRLLLEGVNDPTQAANIWRTIAAAQSLGLEVVAKGVESGEQALLLQTYPYTLHVLGQGYLFGPPVPAEEMGRLLQTQTAAESLETGTGREA